MGQTLTWSGSSHGFYGDLLILEHAGILLRVQQSMGGKLVHLVPSLGEIGNLRFNHLLDRLTWTALELWTHTHTHTNRDNPSITMLKHFLVDQKGALYLNL